jgi:hypothetical protein
MAANTMENPAQADTGLIYAHGVAERKELRGFTTVRDMAGPTFGTKAAIDGGVVAGPRLHPSSSLLSQTTGAATSERATQGQPQAATGRPASRRSASSPS